MVLGMDFKVRVCMSDPAWALVDVLARGCDYAEHASTQTFET
jgi:hypothetical protein